MTAPGFVMDLSCSPDGYRGEGIPAINSDRGINGVNRFVARDACK